MKKYWQRHASKAWCGNNNSINFRDSRYRYMHLVLANTITGREINQRRVSTSEVFYLYSIFERIPCNIAHELAGYFSSQQSHPLKSLMGGSYITRIAKSLGVLSDQIIQEFSPPKAPGIVNCNLIRRTPTQPSQSGGAPIVLDSTPTPNLQQSLFQLPPSSCYRFDMQPELPCIQEHIPTNLSQPLAPNFLPSSSPIIFEEDPAMQETYENMMLQEQLEPESQFPQSFLSLLNEVEQLPPTDEAGPSAVPQMDPHPDQMVVEMARLSIENQDLLRQVQWLTERNQWLESMLAARMQLDPLPPLPDSFESEIDPLHDSFQM